MVCQLRELTCYPQTGLEIPHCQLLSDLVLFHLRLDLPLYLLCILSPCADRVPSAPKLSIPIVQFRVLFLDHQTALVLQLFHVP